MKRFRIALACIASLLASQVQGGTLTVNGNLAVTTNLAAQSITLGGVTLTNWAAINTYLSPKAPTTHTAVITSARHTWWRQRSARPPLTESP